MNELISKRTMVYLSKGKPNNKLAHINLKHPYRAKLQSLSPVPHIIAIIDKEVEQRAYQRYIDIEAKRRIAEEERLILENERRKKEHEEQQRFEIAVNRRMMELRK